ncbi:MAG: hypothetical protein ACRCZK_00785, partial [Oscillospiraceae bacterium]
MSRLKENKIIALSLIVVVAVVTYLIFNNKVLQPYAMINDKGLALSSKSNIEDILINNILDDVNIDTVEIEKNTILYTLNEELYSEKDGMNKISSSFPLFTNSGNYIQIINDQGQLITSEFVHKSVFNGMVFNEGHVYSFADGSILDNDKYILFKTNTGLFINSQDILVKSEYGDFGINKSGIISFKENEISYYNLSGEEFLLSSSNPVSLDDTIIIGGIEYIYRDLLLGINVINSNSSSGLDFGDEDENGENGLTDGEDGSGDNNGGNGAGSGNQSNNQDGSGNGDGSGSGNNNGNSNSSGPTQPKFDFESTVKVSFDNIGVKAYSIFGNLSVDDQNERITTPITFFVENEDERLILRRDMIPGPVEISGLSPNEKIVIYGKYTFRNNDNKREEVEFFRTTLTTKSLDSLSTISYSFSLDSSYSNKVVINNLFIDNNLSDETKSSIKKIDILIANNRFSLNEEDTIKVINGQPIDFKTAESLNSNVNYNLEINAYDSKGNLLNARNNKARFKTRKIPPNVKLKVLSYDTNAAQIAYEFTNKDNLKINSSRYDIITQEGVEVVKGDIDLTKDELNIDDLPSNTSYSFRVFVNYLTEDGVSEELLGGSTRLITSSIDSLGPVIMSSRRSITSLQTVTRQVRMNVSRTNAVLRDIINEAYFVALDITDGPNEEKYKYKKRLTENELQLIKSGAEVEFTATGLDSARNYVVGVEYYVDEGISRMKVAVNDLANISTTHKRPAVAKESALFSIGHFLEFNIFVNDANNSVIDNFLALEVRELNDTDPDTSTGILLESINVEKNKNQRIELSRLDPNKKYKFILKAHEYNEAYDNLTLEFNKVLYQFVLYPRQEIDAFLQLRNLNLINNDANAEVRLRLIDINTQLKDKQFFVDYFEEGKLIKTIKYNIDGSGSFNGDIVEKLKKNKNYDVKLRVEVSGKSYVLFEESFDTHKDIIGLSSAVDLSRVMNKPNAKYVVLNDINYGLTGKIRGQFNGEIDFKGYRIIGHINGTHNSMFEEIGPNGVLKNLNLHFNRYDSNSSVLTGLTGINRGLIQNIFIVSNGNVGNRSFFNHGILASENYGVIENFGIEIKNKFSIENFGGSIIFNHGTVRNGYVVGNAGFDGNFGGSAQNKVIGGVVAKNFSTGLVENIYVTIPIAGRGPRLSNNIGLVVGFNEGGTVQNTYSVGDVKDRLAGSGPNVGSNILNGVSRNNYYNGEFQNNNYNKPVSVDQLTHINFNNMVLNNNDENKGSFNVRDNILSGLYPTLKMGILDNVQPQIKLPIVGLPLPVDIFNLDVISKSDLDAQIKVTIKNPDKNPIKSINFINARFDIDSSKTQVDDDFTYIFGKFTPTVYRSNYSVDRLTYERLNRPGVDIVETFGQNQKLLTVDFYKQIRSVRDWREINNDLSQNYMLANDLNFLGETNIHITGTFRGKFEGNNKTISNINLQGTVQPRLINEIRDTSFNNLFINNVSITDRITTYFGVIGDVVNSRIDNVHINGFTASTGVAEFGTLTAKASSSVISNSSASNVKVRFGNTTNGSNFGGIVGWAGNLSIKNTHVSNLELTSPANREYVSPGGIAGYMQGESVLENVYATGSIIGNFSHAGGLIGHANSTALFINRAYTDIYMEVVRRGGGLIGWASQTPAAILSSVSIGDIISGNDEVARSVFPLNRQPNNADIYAVDAQLLNGLRVENEPRVNIIPLSEFSKENFYRNIVKFGDIFSYKDVEKSVTPKLNYRDSQKLLPNQSDNVIKKELVYYKGLELINLDDRGDESSSVTLKFIISNPLRENIVSLVYNNGINIANVPNNYIVKQNGDDTEITTILSPDDFTSDYSLSSIRVGTREIKLRVSLNIEFYRDLYNARDWNTYVKTNNAYNFRLKDDIVFDTVNISSPNRLLVINALVNKLDGNNKIISASNRTNVMVNLPANRSIFNQVRGGIKDLEFRNININVAGGSGLLAQTNNGLIDNVKFTNIKTTSVSSIATQGLIRNNNRTVSNITLDGMEYSRGTITGVARDQG